MCAAHTTLFTGPWRVAALVSAAALCIAAAPATSPSLSASPSANLQTGDDVSAPVTLASLMETLQTLAPTGTGSSPLTALQAIADTAASPRATSGIKNLAAQVDAQLHRSTGRSLAHTIARGAWQTTPSTPPATPTAFTALATGITAPLATLNPASQTAPAYLPIGITATDPDGFSVNLILFAVGYDPAGSPGTEASDSPSWASP